LADQTGQKTNPRQVAEQIKAKLDLGDLASEISIAGPGFINVRLSPAWLADQLRLVVSDERLGVEQASKPERVVVDYSGPNIAKEMHVGHLRSTIIGDAAARVLAFRGDDVIRQNHFGDWGTQFGRVVLAMWYEAVFERTGNGAILTDLLNQQQAVAREQAKEMAEAAEEEAKAKKIKDPAAAKAALAQVEHLEKAAKDKAGLAVGEIVRQLIPWHQRFINEDPEGTQLFLPSLQNAALSLDKLEAEYVFVSVVTDNAEAKRLTVQRGDEPARTLEELPRLTTTYIQRPQEQRNEQEALAWEKARRVTLDACNAIYKRLGVQLIEPSLQSEPLERPESFYNPFLADVVKDLRAKGLAVESEGATVVNVPGFATPLIIEKGSGGFLYGTTDLAAVRFRTQTLGANRAVYFVDARQGEHFAKVFWTAKQAGWAEGVALEHAAFGTMLGPDGKPFKTRSGDTVKLRDLLDEAEERALAVVNEKNVDLPAEQKAAIAHAVGIGGVKYADLSKDRTSDYEFSFERMLSLEGNTAPYLLYAYARTRSLFRRAIERLAVDPQLVAVAPIELREPAELSLAKHLLRLGDIVEQVARELKPHHLTSYLYELAQKFSSFWENCPVLSSEEPLRSSRLALANLVARVMGKGLDLLGIEHPEQM